MTTLIGTNPDQIPVNSMLGGMAYQDPDSINVKDFNSSGTANIASLVSPAVSITDLSYSGTLTGGTGVINIGSNQIYKDASGNVSLGGTGALKLNEGTTAQRPASPQEGMIRKNSTLGVIEGYSTGEWISLQGGLLNVQVFTSAGVSTYTPTPGTRKIVVELVGGGGGGAYRPSTTVGQVVVPSPGNNADGVVVKYNSIVAAGQTGSVAVGFGGGAQATPGSNGNNGQQSSFSIGGNSVSVGGGLGGTYATATSTFPVVKMSSGFTGSPSITGFTLLKNASSGVSSIGVYSPTLFAPYLSNSPKSSVDTAYGVGDISISSESSSASVGGTGTSGKVIIYEYS